MPIDLLTSESRFTHTHVGVLDEMKGYSPVGTLVEDSVVPQNLTFRPQQFPPKDGVNGHRHSCKKHNKY